MTSAENDPMSSAVSLVEYTVYPEHAQELRDQVRQHLIPAARTVRGYRGFLLLDRGENRRMGILLYDSVEDVRAAQQTLTPIGGAHTYALMQEGAQGSTGIVILSDGVFAGSAPARSTVDIVES